MLQVQGLCKSYDGNPVLAPVSFCLPGGACLGITGENGSGKSTLLRLLAQIETPDSGTVIYREKPVLGDRGFLRTRLGYVPQHTALMEELTVARQLMLWRSACGLEGGISEEIMALMGLEPMLKKRIRTLSGGMKRRVSIAMALQSQPEILVMDEATSGLDREYCEALLSWLEGFLSRGGRVIWCSHHKEELQRLCGSCLEISGGVARDI